MRFLPPGSSIQRFSLANFRILPGSESSVSRTSSRSPSSSVVVFSSSSRAASAASPASTTPAPLPAQKTLALATPRGGPTPPLHPKHLASLAAYRQVARRVGGIAASFSALQPLERSLRQPEWLPAAHCGTQACRSAAWVLFDLMCRRR